MWQVINKPMESLDKVQAREKSFMLKVWRTISDMAAREDTHLPAPTPSPPAPQQICTPQRAEKAEEGTPLRAITNLQEGIKSQGKRDRRVTAGDAAGEGARGSAFKPRFSLQRSPAKG